MLDTYPIYDISGYCVDKWRKTLHPFRIFDIDVYVVYATIKGNIKMHSSSFYKDYEKIANVDLAKILYERSK